MTHHVLAVCGSLRKESFNLRLLKAIVAIGQDGIEFTLHGGLHELPLFDQDLEDATDGQGPESVRQFRAAVAEADGLLIASPEYNRSIPGVLKNAVDWLSRAAPNVVLKQKPVAIAGATPGPWGTLQGQAALRHTLTAIGALVMPTPQLPLAKAGSEFAEDGSLANEERVKQVQTYLAAYRDWLDRFAG